MYRTVVNNLC